MSCCGTSVPLNEIIAAVTASLANQQPKTEYVEKEDGIAKNLTLKGDVALDATAKASLCEALGDCIESAIEEAFKNQPTPESLTIKSFELIGEQLRITMSDGTTFPIDLSQFTTAVEATNIAESIKRTITDEHLTSSSLQGDVLVMVMSSGRQIHVPLAGLGAAGNVSGGELHGNTLVLTKPDGSSVQIDLSQFANSPVAAGNTALANDGHTVLGKFLM